MSGASLTALTTELDQRLAEADALKYGDARRLLAAAQTASTLAQLLGDFRRYGQALTHQAWAYGNLNQFEASLVCAQEALLLARDHAFLEIEARIVGIMAATFCRCGMSYEAAYLYEHQRKLGEFLQINELQAMALNDHAVLKLISGDTEQAIDMLHQSLPLMPSDTHEGIDLATVHLNLSIAAIGANELDASLEHAQYVLALVNAPKLLCDAHLCIASVCMRRNNLPEAYAHVQQARSGIETALPDWYNDNVDQLTAELLMYEQRYQEAAQVWEHMYTMTVQRQEIDFALSALNHLKEVYARINDTVGLISTYKRLAEDIPRLQKQGNDLRFTVLRRVFAMDKAALQAELQLTKHKNAILERLSHEFRTPLTIIQTSAEIVERYGDQMPLKQRQERLQRISAQVQWMTIILEDILELLKLDDQQDIPGTRITFRLDELAQGALNELKRYHMSGIRVRVQTQPGSVRAPKKSLEMVLLHLLTNAIKFSKDEIALDLLFEERVLVMRVVDQGIGIRLDEQGEVFQPLVRGSNLNEIPGMGLGLAIVARLVEQMDATITLESVAGQGTTVTVRVPLA